MKRKGMIVLGNARFSVQEFDLMIEDLLSKKCSFVPLCEIAQKELSPKVYGSFRDKKILSENYDAESMMQDIFLKLIKYTVTGFLLREGPDGPVNRDYKGFRAWMHTVADNEIKDRIEKIVTKLNKTLPDSIDDIELPPTEDADPFANDASIQELQNAFDIIITAGNTGIYKTLTWLVQSVFVIKYDYTRIEANNRLLSEFENKTLWEMYEMLISYESTLPWLALTEKHKKIIEDALREQISDKGITYADAVYSDFFMSKGAKASVSDWVNRLDSKIRRYYS